MRILLIALFTLLALNSKGQYTQQTNPDWDDATVTFRAQMKAAKMPLTYAQLNAFDTWAKAMAYADSVIIAEKANQTDTARWMYLATQYQMDSVKRYVETVNTTLTSSLSSVSTTLNTFTGSFIVGSATLDFPSTNSQRSADLAISIPSATRGDVVALGHETTLANCSFTAFVGAHGSVTVRFNNYHSASQDPASSTFKVIIIKLNNN